ncbi:hypothetical protein [Burkholderia cepacia]|uniref:hypothetical protein n=1 Tax=Burkholderia cepacia TaxID=292 RepID=UPI000AEA1396|nr:hypothetical protein [Burkholderia cepacia]
MQHADAHSTSTRHAHLSLFMVVILRGDAIHRIEAVPRGFDRDQRMPATWHSQGPGHDARAGFVSPCSPVRMQRG